MQPPSGGRGQHTPAITRFALAHPWAVLTTWLSIVAILGVVGLGIDGKLSAAGLNVKGSESSRAAELIGGNFGDSATLPILLRGPRADVKRQGRRLAARLADRPGMRVLSPWTSSSGRSALRPSSDRALLLISVTGTHDEIARRSQTAEKIVDRATSSPVHATITGLPLLSRDGQRSSLNAIHRAELIALPLLLLALLLVFRSPLAAAIPALFGATTIAAATGALALLASVIRLDAFGLAISCMVGLALAVDYSLLLVSRVREELGERGGGDIRAAIGRATAPTTRTVAVAAAAIVVAMAVAAAMSPGTGLLAAAIGVSVVAVLSAAAAMLAVPAVLVLAGGHIGAASTSAATDGGMSSAIAHAAMRRPALAGIAAVLLLVASIPVLSLRTGAPAAQSLPSGSTARAQYDDVSTSMGPGWTEPFELVAVTRKGAVTTQARLTALERVQRKLAKDPAVRAVLGPGTIARSAARLRQAGRRAVSAPAPSGGKRLRRVNDGVSSAADGVQSLRSSLSSATSSANRVSAGSRDLQGGVGQLRSGLDGAGSGARALAGKLKEAGRGADGLVSQSSATGNGARSVRSGARQLSDGLGTLASSARDLNGRLRQRVSALDSVRASVREQRRQVDEALAAAERATPATTTAGIRTRAALRQARQALAADTAAALDEPLRMISMDAEYASRIAAATPARDAAKLASAVGELADSAESISKRVQSFGGSVSALTDGSDSLVAALDKLDGAGAGIGTAFAKVREGVDGLASGVRSTEARTGALASGLDDARSAVRGLDDQAAVSSPTATKAANASFFDSGYFLLAALESGSGGTPFGVNIDKGGQGARIVVIPRYPAADPRTQALYERLRTASTGLGKTLGAETAVGGPAAVLSDYESTASSRLPLIVLVLTLVTALLLAILLRSIVVPLIGVVLNLMAVGATLGLLALLFQGANPLFGGPGEIDAVAITAIFGVVFALSIDYQVFIVSRVREEWLRGADEGRAVELGLSRTARVVTGAALSMLGVFIAFGLADVASLRQFGVGLAIAIIIDATLVRLVLLPAALYFAGEWAWWLPGFEVEKEPYPGLLIPATEHGG
ncbi:MAG TPA: MMPL family transporter [Solirubrobacteraceae bacterium]|nr:MMPL family transporter [Solirubrobacteraceae bacterium]